MTDLAYLFQVVWTENSPPGRLIVLTLLAITLSALACAMSHKRRYRTTETDMLQVARARLQTARDGAPKPAAPADSGTKGTPDASRTVTPKIVDIDELAKGLSDATLVGDRLNTIARLRKSQVKVSVAALQQITNDRESARASLRFPEFAIGLLMLIGLFGTFVGIATTFQAVGADVTSAPAVTSTASIASRTQVLELRVQGAFAGMRTKFSASLAGLLGAILLSLANLQLARAQGRFLSDLERFTVVDLLPATIPTVEDELMLDRVARQLDEGFTRLESLAAANIRTMEEIAGIQAGFRTIVDNIASTTRASGGERLQAVIGQLASVIDQVVHVNQSVRELTTNLPKTLESSAARIERAVGAAAGAVSPWRQSATAVIGVGVAVGLIILLFAASR